MEYTQRMNNVLFVKLQENPAHIDAAGIVARAFALVGERRIVLASSLSVEDQVLTHLLCGATANPRIFTLDTGRLFPETYDAMERTMEHYGFRYEALAPESGELGKMLTAHGPNLFYRGIELRHECCRVRKVEPLRRVLATADAWICGLRRDQATTRSACEPVEADAANDIIKINPLWNWTEAQVWQFVNEHDIPYNPLHDRGFRSIGCQPCTRAIGTDDDLRSGRWWWEEPEHKECGLHNRPPLG